MSTDRPRWKVGENRFAGRCRLIMEDGSSRGFVCEVQAHFLPDGAIDEARLAGDCSLIAAAPDLLDALDHPLLNQLLGLIEDGIDDGAWSVAKLWMDTRDAALARATTPPTNTVSRDSDG